MTIFYFIEIHTLFMQACIWFQPALTCSSHSEMMWNYFLRFLSYWHYKGENCSRRLGKQIWNINECRYLSWNSLLDRTSDHLFLMQYFNSFHFSYFWCIHSVLSLSYIFVFISQKKPASVGVSQTPKTQKSGVAATTKVKCKLMEIIHLNYAAGDQYTWRINKQKYYISSPYSSDATTHGILYLFLNNVRNDMDRWRELKEQQPKVSRDRHAIKPRRTKSWLCNNWRARVYEY